MHIWLLNPYGPIPGEGWRDYRFTLLGRELARRGHAVTWWTANFSHHFKRYRSPGWQDIPVSPGFTIRLVPTTAYTLNISLGRIRFEVNYARRVHEHAANGQRPDFIIGTDPSQIVGYLSVKLAHQFGVPLILDVFDLWPELFVLAFPSMLRSLAPLALSPLAWLRRHNLRRANAVTALCDTYLDMAKRQAPNQDAYRTLTIFNGIDVAAFRNLLPDAEAALALAVQMGKQAGDIWAIYAGSLGNNYDIITLLEAAVELARRQSCIKILIAGDGPLRPQIMEFIEAHQPRTLKYLGKLSHADLIKLYGICDIGICAYAPESNVAMPDKAYDYMAAGLPIVNSLRGELAALLQERAAGVPYLAGSSQSLADVLDLLASDEQSRKTMASNSYGLAAQFDQNLQYGRFAEFIERFIEDKQARN